MFPVHFVNSIQKPSSPLQFSFGISLAQTVFATCLYKCFKSHVSLLIGGKNTSTQHPFNMETVIINFCHCFAAFWTGFWSIEERKRARTRQTKTTKWMEKNSKRFHCWFKFHVNYDRLISSCTKVYKNKIHRFYYTHARDCDDCTFESHIDCHCLWNFHALGQ